MTAYGSGEAARAMMAAAAHGMGETVDELATQIAQEANPAVVRDVLMVLAAMAGNVARLYAEEIDEDLAEFLSRGFIDHVVWDIERGRLPPVGALEVV